MLILLAFGVGAALMMNPGLWQEITQISFRFRLPEIYIGKITWQDLIAGTLVLGLPPSPFDSGKCHHRDGGRNNELFPDRPAKVKTIAVDHGIMNIFSAAIGGVPLCHGAGGMAGHVRFGARTGGALVILGIMILFLGLFFSDSVATIFKFFPPRFWGNPFLHRVGASFPGSDIAASGGCLYHAGYGRFCHVEHGVLTSWAWPFILELKRKS